MRKRAVYSPLSPERKRLPLKTKMGGCVVKKNKKSIIGWIGVFITTSLSGVWAYWGATENFHEGWYSVSLWENLFMMFFQYLLITIILVCLAVIILRWKKIGLILHFSAAVFSARFFFRGKFQRNRADDCNSDNRDRFGLLFRRTKAKEMGLQTAGRRTFDNRSGGFDTEGDKSFAKNK